jgi:HK97 gp10 family phage protein
MVEFGTVKMKAKPFLRPALNAAKPQIQSILRNGE